MKKIINYTTIIAAVLISVNSSYAFDMSNIKELFTKKEGVKIEKVMEKPEVQSTTTNTTLYTTENLNTKSSSTDIIINSTTTVSVAITSTSTASTTSTTTKKENKDLEILKGDKCEVKKIKLNSKKDKVIKNIKSQKEDSMKVADVVNKVIEKLDTNEESDIQISANLELKLEGFAKEVNDATKKETEIVNLIASTTEMSCTNKNFEKNITNINKLELEAAVQLGEAKDYLQVNIKGALKDIN